jgi:hypothetical protein
VLYTTTYGTNPNKYQNAHTIRTYDMQDRTCIVAITFEQSDRKANIIYMQYNLLITDTIGFVSKPFVEAIREKHDENVISKS